MIRRRTAPLSRHLKLALLGCTLLGAAVFAIAQTQPAASRGRTDLVTANGVVLPGDRILTSSPLLMAEATRLIGLLDQFHYNHEAVKSTDYPAVIPDYMGELDNQRLFFLNTDKTKFLDEYGSALFFNLQRGRLEAAYQIFAVYDQRVRARTAWIFNELKKDPDLNSDEMYAYDRSKIDWPANEAEADAVWRKRLKFEILGEVLGAKAAERATPEALKATVQKAKDVVQKRYERLNKTVAEYKSTELAEIFLTNVAQLYDPHSSYFSAESFEDFTINIRLNLYGIGALLELNKDDYICTIKEIIPGGPADIGKVLRPEDKIIAVGQGKDPVVDVQGWKLRDIVQLIRGKKDSEVHLVINPAASADTSARKDIYITRDLVKLDNAKAHAAIFDVPATDGKSTVPLGVISLPAFYGGETDGERTSSSRDVADLIKKLQGAGMKGLVLDLRHNGGGLLSEAIDLAGLFISRGPVVQVKRSDKSIIVDPDEDPGVAYSGPLAVLVDRYSASASEIVAGALQNYGRAIIIGDTSTHGKGTVQQIVEMEGMITRSRGTGMMANNADEKYGAAKVTIQKFYLPNGSSTQRKGVVPDIVLPSIDEFISQIGEADLPRALVFDSIPAAPDFKGKPLDLLVVDTLQQSSRTRQEKLPEFEYLKRTIDRFKTQQEQKELALSLTARLKQKEADQNFIKEMKTERNKLAEDDYKYTEYRLAPATPPSLRAKAEADDDISLIDDNERELPYGKVDIHLRESLRIVSDAVTLAGRPAFSGHDPLTAVTLPVPGRN